MNAMRLAALCACLTPLPVAAFSAPSPNDAPPTVSLPRGTTALDDVGLYAVRYRYLDGKEGAKPLGWSGHFDDATGISCTPFGAQGGRRAFLLHPPWRGGTGETDQDFRLALPRAQRITLRFAVAMKEGETGPGKSDGATFRVYVNGEPKVDTTRTDAVWDPHELDLTPFAGKTIALRFETDPGPAHNSSFDYALWGDRQIVVAGSAEPLRVGRPRAFPIAGARSTFGSAAPVSPVGADIVGFAVTSVRGASGLLGGLAVRAGADVLPLGNGAAVELVDSQGRSVRSDSPAVDASSTVGRSPAPGVTRRIVTYAVGGRKVALAVDTWPARHGVVRVDLSSSDPYVAGVDFGAIGPVAFRRQVTVPYLGVVQFLPQQGLFTNVVVDFTRSNASQIEGVVAQYRPLTDGSRNPVRETAYYAVSPSLLGVLPTPPNAASPYRKLLSDRVVLDVWSGDFADNGAWLREMAGYGMTHFATIAHVWQNGGYDNKLPDVLPALASMGGDEGMKAWVKAAVELKQPIALHENYVDFYPNAPSYDEQDVARDSSGALVPAWKNIIQSYAVAPTAILKYARRITPQVHSLYGTNASYLDVHSAVPPWFHVDFRAGVPGAGRFSTVWQAHTELWKLFRQVHGGPVLGEGANHWYWSGLLDGVEAQFGVGVPGNGGESAPLFVDFDLAKIHPLQFNHGMGYLERWTSTGYDAGWDTRVPPMKVLDQYRMQEVAYGHAGFIASPLVRNLPFIWQEHNLVWPVTARYGAAQPTEVRYETDGRYLSAEDAVQAATPFDRVRVRYDTGLTVWANGRSSAWDLQDTARLPQFGWFARGAGVTAYTAERQGVVVDYARTADTLFANARTTVVTRPSRTRVTPGVAAFQQTGARRFRIQFRWDVQQAIPAGETPFIHVTGPGGPEGGDIFFQIGAPLARRPDAWPVGQVTESEPVEVTIPANLKDGRYGLRTGLYAQGNGERLPLLGRDDGGRRIDIGTLVVSDGGATIALEPPTKPAPTAAAAAALETAHVNVAGKRVDFGEVLTDGSVLLQRQASGSWLAYPFPRDSRFFLAVDPAAFGSHGGSLRVTAETASGRALGPVPTRPAGTRGLLAIDLGAVPGAARYRLTPAAR